jgi:hypothetical protein
MLTNMAAVRMSRDDDDDGYHPRSRKVRIAESYCSQ